MQSIDLSSEAISTPKPSIDGKVDVLAMVKGRLKSLNVNLQLHSTSDVGVENAELSLGEVLDWCLTNRHADELWAQSHGVSVATLRYVKRFEASGYQCVGTNRRGEQCGRDNTDMYDKHLPLSKFIIGKHDRCEHHQEIK